MASQDLFRIDKFFSDIEREVVAIAGIAASSYAKDSSKAVAEEWAEILARNIEMGLVAPELADQTEENRQARGNPIYPAWFETGQLISHIEIRWTRMPQKNYDLIEVGIWDDSTQIGHDDDITPYKLGLINEYGFKGSFKGEDGKVHKINIPARPHFRNSALDLGYELDRVVTDAWNKTQVAIGRERRSIIRNNLTGTLLNDLAVSAPGRFGGSGPEEVITGRFHVNGRKIIFRWDKDASDSSQKDSV